MSDDPGLPELARSAKILKEYGEHEHAENIAEYVDMKNNRKRRLVGSIKSLVGWSVIVGFAVVSTVGFISLVGDGKWLAGGATLLLTLGSYLLMTLVVAYTDALEKGLKEQIFNG